MADPLNVTASIVTLLQLSTTMVKYLSNVKDADDFKGLIVEIASIEGLLSTLQDLAQPGRGWPQSRR